MNMVRSILVAALLLFGAQATASAQAATAPVAKPAASVPAKKVERCRDAKGKFVACKAKPARATCRDAKGKFIKCPAQEAAATDR